MCTKIHFSTPGSFKEKNGRPVRASAPIFASFFAYDSPNPGCEDSFEAGARSLLGLVWLRSGWRGGKVCGGAEEREGESEKEAKRQQLFTPPLEARGARRYTG